MNVSLTPELETLVAKKVKSGLYNSASEVMRDALRLFEERDQLRELRRDELRKEIAKGASDIKAGRSVVLKTQEDFDRVAEEIRKGGRKALPARKRK
jgi:antitoxin ParD1/3/4